MPIKFNIENISDIYIENFVIEFIEENSDTIKKLCVNLYKDNSIISFSAFKEIIKLELIRAVYSFANNNNDPNYINSYLFSAIYKIIKSLNNEGKKNIYICPGCKYFSRFEILVYSYKKLICNYCKTASRNNEWEKVFYSTFSEHSRKGYMCLECENFIPNNNNSDIICPYPDCLFVGNISELKEIRHPLIKANLEIPILNEPPIDYKSSDIELIVKEDIDDFSNILNEIIDAQITLVQYKSNQSTLISKLCMYEAYKNMIIKYPNDMISYLVFLHRNIGIQHKIFQEYINLLELKIPFSFTKNGKLFEVKSLLDENLCIFDGVSEFDAIIDNKNEVQNLTKELYVGNRKGFYCRSYYIGKLIDIIDIDTDKSIIEFVKEYSFSKIVLNVKSGTNVKVKHFRIFPHYQMGAMVHLNRIRRAIVDATYLKINGIKRKIKYNEKMETSF